MDHIIPAHRSRSPTLKPLLSRQGVDATKEGEKYNKPTPRVSLARPSLSLVRQGTSGRASVKGKARPSAMTEGVQVGRAMKESKTEQSHALPRPIPFELLYTDGRNLYLTRSSQGFVEVRDSDKVTPLYRTNVSWPASRGTKLVSPNQLEVTSASHYGTSMHELATTTIVKVRNEIAVTIKGLEPVKFFKARPDCIFPVNCFVARQVALKSTLSADSARACQVFAKSLQFITYAWKHTSMVGKGGLKLVDLRDNEVVAYYEVSKGKNFGKVRLQGSGLVIMRLVITTILALKFKHLLREYDPTQRCFARLLSDQLRYSNITSSSKGTLTDKETTLADSEFEYERMGRM